MYQVLTSLQTIKSDLCTVTVCTYDVDTLEIERGSTRWHSVEYSL
jgi:hypothetical protein